MFLFTNLFHYVSEKPKTDGIATIALSQTKCTDNLVSLRDRAARNNPHKSTSEDDEEMLPSLKLCLTLSSKKT